MHAAAQAPAPPVDQQGFVPDHPPRPPVKSRHAVSSRAGLWK